MGKPWENVGKPWEILSGKLRYLWKMKLMEDLVIVNGDFQICSVAM